MTTLLNEIPGALERPSHCKVVITEQEGIVRIDVPERGASPVMWLATGAMAAVLLMWIVTGLTVLIARKPIFLLAWIANHGLPSELYRYALLFCPLWIAPLALGSYQLNWILRTYLTRESLVFNSTELRYESTFLRWQKVTVFPREVVRAFAATVDPQGFTQGALKLVTQGDRIGIAEHVTDADRQWLASVGNALLRESIK